MFKKLLKNETFSLHKRIYAQTYYMFTAQTYICFHCTNVYMTVYICTIKSISLNALGHFLLFAYLLGQLKNKKDFIYKFLLINKGYHLKYPQILLLDLKFNYFTSNPINFTLKSY